jgi:D-beta-D-heptose 7-phosphate kinase/D-beta-D-heptose 1-phosphate adenosyltransferase
MKVWTNGCFDILHRGHMELFKYAKSLGDELVVGIDSDEKVKLDKGKNRPIVNLQDRIFMLQSIKYIDKVIPFDSTEDLHDTIKWYRPDIMVIGSDWKGKEVIGEMFTDKLVFFDRVGDYSTTKLSNNINH